MAAISTNTSSSSSEVKPWLRPERMSLKGLTAEQKCERREYLLNRWKKNNPDKVKKGHDKWSEKRRAERGRTQTVATKSSESRSQLGEKGSSDLRTLANIANYIHFLQF